MGSITRLLSAIALVQLSFAQIDDSDLKVPSLKPVEASLAQDSFWEDFQNYKDNDELFEKWKLSRIGLKDSSTGQAKPMYPAKWTLQQPYHLKSFRGDQCLTLATANAPAMIGRVLPHVLDVAEGSKLVVQYEVQLQNSLECGGAFLKLLSKINETELFHYGSGNPLLEIVFGPDKCLPYTDEVHLGFRKVDPFTGEPQMKMLTNAPPSRLEGDRTVRLYTLVIDATTQDYEIRIDGQVAKAGNLLDEGSFEPGFHAPKLVPDVKAKCPDDWDERETIPDPNAHKPEEWDENEPVMIPDEEDTKPKTWDESMPVFIPNPNSKKPTWWRTSKDGEWVAPLIRNPECFKIAGCGPWQPRMVENPDYWGPWNPPLIDNPNYMGKWEPPLVANPKYYENIKPAQLENGIGGVAFEFWSGSKDLLIDNLYIGLHLEEAESLGNQTFLHKKKFQREQIEADIIGHRGSINHPKRPPTMRAEETVHNVFDKLADYADMLLQKFSEQSSLVQNIMGGTFIVLVLSGTTFFFLKMVMFQQDYSQGLGILNAGEKKEEEKRSGKPDSGFEELEFEPRLEKEETEDKAVPKNEEDVQQIAPQSTKESTGIFRETNTLKKRGK